VHACTCQLRSESSNDCLHCVSYLTKPTKWGVTTYEETFQVENLAFRMFENRPTGLLAHFSIYCMIGALMP
jgi:hypothetical protein